MNKRYLSGLTGGVALCALVAVLGVPFFTQTMQGSIGGGDQGEPVTDTGLVYNKIQNFDDKNVVDANSLTNNIVRSEGPIARIGRTLMGEKDNADYVRAMEETNKARAKAAAQTGGSALPTPAPATQTQGQPRVDALKEWKDSVQARKIAPSKAAAPQAYVGGNRQASSGGLERRFTAEQEMPAPGATSFDEDIAEFKRKVEAAREQNRDKFEQVEESPVKQVAAEPVSTFSIDVDTSSYSFMRRAINMGQMPAPGSIRPEELINYFPYSYPTADSREAPFQPTIAVTPSPWRAGAKLVHIGIKGYDIAHDSKPRANLVFLLDVSGSMNSMDKLPLVKNSLKMMLDTMNPEDTISIVTYAGHAGTALEPTPASEKARIIAALDSLGAGGSTAGAQGIEQAYNLAKQSFVEGGVNRVILATDGDFNVGISNPNELKDFIEKKRDSGIFLSVLGFGQGNYNDHLMQSLAQNGNGVAAYIDTLSEARKVLVEEASSTLFTIAKDVKIQVEFNPKLVQEYRLVGYETRHLNREDFNNDKVDAGDVGAGHAVTAIYEITPVGAAPVVDALRYGEGTQEPTEAEEDAGGEYAFLKIRYKLPDENVSKLITRPITHADDVELAKASDDTRFSIAVAGFAELLKNSKYARSLTYENVIEQAEAARGRDEFGYRAEFVNLVRLAKSFTQE